MKNAAKMVKNLLPKVKIRFDELTKRQTVVGVPQEKTDRKEEGINNATLAYIHDNGSPAANIPARQFMRPGIEAVQGKISKVLGVSAQKALEGDSAAVEQGLNKVGLIAQNSIKGLINEGIAPELSESTLAARRRKGAKGTKPLIRTGQFRNSITYVLRSK